MASESEASCEEDPNFAIICAFLEKFGSQIGITDVDFHELQSMLENTVEVPKYLLELHIKLLRKIRKSLHIDRWEKALVKVCHTFNTQDAWEVERFGYKKSKLSSKVRILKELLEMQFDHNNKFKTEVNKLTPIELRSQPIGRDKLGHAYWFQSDDNYQIRVYKEDLDDEKWTLVAKDRDGLASLINSLNDGDAKLSSDSAGNEDSNSLSEKPIIDTGQQDTDSKKTTSDDEEDDSNQTKKSKDEADDKPVLRLKNLKELMPSPKRPREETEEERIFQKYKIKSLEVRVSDIAKEEAVVGEAVEEPVGKVEGEGSGADNESPIVVGEAVEEEVMYFYGPGCGHDCQTGNETEKKSGNDSSLSGAGGDGAGEIKCTTQPEKSVPDFSSSISSNSAESPKKNIFFFGSSSSSFKSSLLSSTTMAFGNTKQAEDVAEESEKSDDASASRDETDCNIVNTQDEGDEGDEEPPKDKELGKEEAEMKKNGTDSDNAEETRENVEPREHLEHSQKETDLNLVGDESEKADHVESTKEIIEPVCVKKIAYVCGDDEEKVESTQLSTSETNLENQLVVEGEDNKITLSPAENVMKNIVDSNGLVQKQQNKTDSENDESATEQRQNEEGKEEEEEDVQPEVVYISGRTRSRRQSLLPPSAALVKKVPRPVKKGVKDGTVAKKKDAAEAADNDLEEKNAEEKSKVQSTESSITTSPTPSVGDNSVISVDLTAGDSCIEAPEADPLAVSDTEGDSPKTTGPAAAVSVTSFSLDFTDAPAPAPKRIPIIPSPMRAVRKRGREEALVKPQDADNRPGKRMKLKGRRQVDAALRKSVEQRIEQLHGSSSESKDSEEEKPTPKSKKGGRWKKKSRKNVAGESDEADSKSHKSPIKRDPAKKNSRILAGLIIPQELIERPGLRQSSRIAQLKIREQAEPTSAARLLVDDKGKKKTKSKDEDKNAKPEKRKRNKQGKEEEDVSEPEVIVEKKKKKKKEKPMSQLFNENRPWQSSTDDSDDVVEEEEEEEEIIEEDDDPPLEALKSDHEFSPESDLENDDDEWQPMKRARTARKDSDEDESDEFPCQKCGKNDHPEWILLCDKCDNGWHCSCLRPPLLVIPEGDWFCPPCQHVILLEQLQLKLIEYDKKLSKKEIEDRRKERLAYVGISLNNVLPSKEHSEHRKKKRRHSAEEYRSSSSESASGSDFSGSDSGSDSDEPIYQLRQRRQAKSYKFNEYDEMMKTAIGEEIDKPEDTAGNLGRGKDIQTIVKGLEPEPTPPAANGDEAEERPPVTNLKKMLRKKHRKLNSLEVDSEEEDISDEDFKGTSTESEDEEEESAAGSEESDDYLGKKRRKYLPVRRSARARTRRYDDDFVNDDSEEEAPRRKKKRSIWDDTETEESDASGWSRRRRGKKKKKKKKGGELDDSDLEPSKKKNRPRIKYGGLTTSEEEDLGRGRRTRGKKTTYVDTLGSDSEEEVQARKNPRRIESDEDDEDFIANEEDEVDDDEDKESEEKFQEEEDEEDSEKERREKRSLLVPKIYIKKPLGNKIQKDPEPKEKRVLLPFARDEKEKTDDMESKQTSSEHAKDSSAEENAKMPPVESREDDDRSSAPLVEKMEVNEVKKSAEKEEYAERQLQMATAMVQEEKETRSQLATQISEQKPAAAAAAVPVKVPAKRGRKPKPKVVHEPIVSNVSALIRNDDENDDLSEPPGISLPLFDELASTSPNLKNAPPVQDTPKRRRGRGPGKAKKTLEESLAGLGGKTVGKGPTDKPAIEIAAPPQPFSQAQPAPSVITRMLQAKPGQATVYPVGTIRPKQFATMPDDDSDEPSPTGGTSRGSSPSGPPLCVPRLPPNHYGMPGGPRGPPMAAMFRPHLPPHPAMNHYPRVPPPPIRGPPPAHPYSHHPSHRPMDPSPSGGGPVNLADPGPGPPPSAPLVPPGPPPLAPPGQDSPGGGVRGPPVSRYLPTNQAPPGARPPLHLPPRQPYPPPSAGGVPPPPPEAYYGSYSPNGEEAMPPNAYQSLSSETGSPYPEQYGGDDPPPVNLHSDNSNSKTYDEESGEFAGLASYFSSQREDDDLES